MKAENEVTAEQSGKMEDEKMKMKWQLNKVERWKMKSWKWSDSWTKWKAGRWRMEMKSQLKKRGKREDEKTEMESHL